MPSGLWIKHIPPGVFLTVTPSSKLLIVNASLGYELQGERDRVSLRLGHTGAVAAPCVAAFARDTCEQVRLELVLSANVHYAFFVSGPFPVDLVGYYMAERDHAELQYDGSESKAKELEAMESKTKELEATESKAKESKAKESKVKESKAKESKAKESKAKESKAKESKATESKAKESKATGSKRKEPKVKAVKAVGEVKEPKAKASKTIGSKASGSKAKKPTPSSATPAALERRASLRQLVSRKERVPDATSGSEHAQVANGMRPSQD